MGHKALESRRRHRVDHHRSYPYNRLVFPGRYLFAGAMGSRVLLYLALGVVAAAVLLGGCSRPPETLTLATTTSTADSGLLDYLLPPFEKANNVRVKVVAVGTGQAITLGQRGDADVLLVHARALEDRFVAEGHGINRVDVMYNDFVLLGPSSDPAAAKGSKTGPEAFQRTAQAGEAGRATFASRGDGSGTHTKELAIWKIAGIAPEGKGWYRSTGQGMGETLTVASEMHAYTLSDRATYLTRRDNLVLVILAEGDTSLLNPYGVIAVNPKLHPNVKYELAMKFSKYLTSVETQKRIADFGKTQYGQSLFFPDSQEWRAQKPTE